MLPYSRMACGAAILVASLFASIVTANSGVYDNYNKTCGEGWTTIPETSDLVYNLTEDAFWTWLYEDSATTDNISCDSDTTIDHQTYVNTACKNGNVYEISFTATFQCFYNQTPYQLPIEDTDAVLGDVVLLDAQMMLDSPDSETDDSVQIVFVNTDYAFETYDGDYDIPYSDYYSDSYTDSSSEYESA